ncbi:MAG: bacteriohemerythrin [Oscillospiraceae bacterium]|jgi:hemerythrin|nr:bacteriohemerythrin [Oscillospiraceae bacterium]
MSIRAWSDDYVSGFEVIDTHHKTLFTMINTFAEENDEHASADVVMDFLGSLLKYCDYHFGCEEAIMIQYGYPLVEYHTGIHRDLTQTVKKTMDRLSCGDVAAPYDSVISFSTEWLNNHIARDDLSFLSFYKNRDYDLSENFLGKQCIISKLNNEIVGIGKITSIKGNEVVISHNVEKRMPLESNDMAKITASSSQSGTQMFIAKAYYSGLGEVKLFNATIIMTLNRRQHFRVSTDIEAALWLGNKAYPATIANIGAGGVLVDTYQQLEPSQLAKVEFVAENNRFLEECRETNTIKRVGAPNSYGMHFTSMGSGQFDKLTTYVFNRQTLIRRSKLS